jgi:hypothetical protein
MLPPVVGGFVTPLFVPGSTWLSVSLSGRRLSESSELDPVLDPSLSASVPVLLVVVLSDVVALNVVLSDVVVVGAVVGLATAGRLTAPFGIAAAASPEEVPAMPVPDEAPIMPEPALAIGTVAVGAPIGMSARASAAASSWASGMQSVMA